jgi:putative transposase
MLKLNMIRNPKIRIPRRVKGPLLIPWGINKTCSMELMSDSLINGRFRLLNVMDYYNREFLAIEVGTLLPTQRVIRVFDRLVEYREKQK